MKYTDVSAQDHAVLRRGVDILDRMVQTMEQGERIEIFDIRTVLKFLRLFDDQFHQRPFEPEEERELLASIEAALSAKQGTVFVRSSRRLILLLRNRVEETIAAEFMTNPTQSETFAAFARLERKYAPKLRAVSAEPGRAHA